MVLEISMYFEGTPIGIFGTISLSYFLFTSHFAIFLHSIYRGECAEQNALGLRRRLLMVFRDLDVFLRDPYRNFGTISVSHFLFTSNFAIFRTLFIEENALKKMR